MVTILIILSMVLSIHLGLYAATHDKEKKSVEQRGEFLPISAFTKEDAEWMEHALWLAGIEKEVVITCSCGYAEECGMHCNHGRHPDCIGPSYFALNGIETKKKPPVPAGPGSGSQWGGRFVATQTPDLLTTNELRALYQSALATDRQRQQTPSIYGYHEVAYDQLLDAVIMQNQRGDIKKVPRAMYEDILMHEQPANSFLHLLEEPAYETIYR